jgi:peptidoglycan/LPS O-acetylase OafA/YrhL
MNEHTNATATMIERPAAAPARPAEGARDEALDGLRGVACLLVYFYHFGLDVRRPPLVVLGYTGVHIFFVLSGYLMFGPFLAALLGDRPMPSWRRYAVRRFTRIYPPYAVALVLFTVARHVVHLKPPRGANVLTHALLVFNFFDREDFLSINAVFWSLAIEAQFYVPLPLAAWAAAKLMGRGGWRAAAAVVVGFALTGLAARGFEHARTAGPSARENLPRFTTVFSYLDLFAAGMAAACVERALGARLGRSGGARWIWILAGLGTFVAANNWSLRAARGDWISAPHSAYTVAYPFLLCAGVGLVLVGIRARPAGAWSPLTWGPLVAVGRISYSIYLYHIGVQMVANMAVDRWARWAWPQSGLAWFAYAAAVLVPTLLVSALMFVLVERPAMRWGARDSLHNAPSDAQRTAVRQRQ